MIAGASLRKELEDLLTGAAYPVRNVTQNVNDLIAQVAANEKGVAELRKMVTTFGLDVVRAYMGHVQDNAAESVRNLLDNLTDCSFAYEMDQGCVIRVAISVDREKPPGEGGFHRHLAAARGQFQRTHAGDPRCSALRLPGDGR